MPDEYGWMNDDQLADALWVGKWLAIGAAVVTTLIWWIW